MTGILNLLAGAVGVVKDTYFNLVTLLLPGDGTNGAQNNTFLDSSTNNFTITRNGNTTQGTFSPFSQTGWSNYFNGSSSIDVASNAALALGTGDFTYEIWLCDTATPPNSANPSHVIGVNSSGGGVLRIYDTGIDFNTYAVGSPVSYSVTRPIGTWYHIAYSRQGTTGRLFYNGSLVATGTDSANYSSSTSFIIGSNPTTGQFYTGYASNARIVKGTALYTASFTPSTTPLTAVSGTSLLTCQSNRFVDNSSNGLAITVRYGTPSVQAFSPFAPTAAYSVATNGGSGYFDGTGDYLNYSPGSAFAFGTGDFTVEGWAYFSNATNEAFYFIDARNTGQTTNWCLLKDPDAAVFWFDGVNSYKSGNNTITQKNTWYHVAYTRSGTTGRIFINGVQTGGNFTDTTNYSTSVTTAYTGCRYNQVEFLTGYFGGIRVVKGTALYTSNFTPPTTPFTAVTNTSFLLNFTNAGITDATAKNALETVGNAQISTTQSKFGGSSMYFDGTGDYLVAPASQGFDFGTGDFTIEGWIYPNVVNTTQLIYDVWPNGLGSYTTGQCQFLLNSSAKLVFNVATGVSALSTLTSTTSISATTWTHFALVRSGTGSGNVKLYINGTADATTLTMTGKVGLATRTPAIGTELRTLTATYFNGYIDDLRITTGYARYTSNFTAPTAAFALQ